MAQPVRAQPEGAPAPPDSAYAWYVGGAATWFGAMGMQSVLFSWLVVGELQAEARWVGIAQSASMLPNFLLILLGGAIADRVDRRHLVARLHVVAALCAAVLWWVVFSGSLSLAALILFALAMGTLGAFSQPARDALLSEVVRGDMMRAVAGLTVMQWTAQAVGALLAGTARWIGVLPALGGYGLLLLSGAPTLYRLPARRLHPELRARPLALADLGEGLREVAGSPELRPVMLLAVAVGALFMGPFMVVFPLLIRDVYGGDELWFGLVSAAFPIGTILGSVGILLRGGIRRKGLAQVGALIAGSLFLGVVAFDLPFWGTLLAILLWGSSGAVFMNAGRTVFQERATDANRARVLSVYTLGFMGAAGLFGAPFCGVLVEAVGPQWTCLINSAVMVVVATGIGLATPVRHLE